MGPDSRPRLPHRFVPPLALLSYSFLTCMPICEKPLHPNVQQSFTAGRIDGAPSKIIPPPPLPFSPPKKCVLLEVSLTVSPSRLRGRCSIADPLFWPLQEGRQEGRGGKKEATSFLKHHRLMLYCSFWFMSVCRFSRLRGEKCSEISSIPFLLFAWPFGFPAELLAMLHGVDSDHEGEPLIHLLSLTVAAVALEGNKAAPNYWIFLK